MWLMTRHGFFSIVEKPAKGQFQLRSRERRDLENLLTRVPLPGVELLDTPQGDYAARILLDSAQLAAVMAFLGSTIDYPNFKDRIDSTSDQAHKSYHKVWQVMARALGAYGSPGTCRPESGS